MDTINCYKQYYFNYFYKKISLLRHQEKKCFLSIDTERSQIIKTKDLIINMKYEREKSERNWKGKLPFWC